MDKNDFINDRLTQKLSQRVWSSRLLVVLTSFDLKFWSENNPIFMWGGFTGWDFQN